MKHWFAHSLFTLIASLIAIAPLHAARRRRARGSIATRCIWAKP